MEHEPSGKIEKGNEKELPEVHFRFLFASHRTAKDQRLLKEELEKTDVYVPECLGWDQEFQSLYQKVSDGDLDPQKPSGEFKRWVNIMPEIDRYELGLLFNSHKRIIFADIPMENEEMIAASDAADLVLWDALERFKKGSLQLAVNRLKIYLTKEADFELKREELIKKSLLSQIAALAQNYSAAGVRRK